jgi:CBS domain-containing protein
MGASNADGLAITSDGTVNGRMQAIVTRSDLGRLFGDRPHEILRDLSHAGDSHALRQLNQRARSLVLQHLTSAGASDWLAHFTLQVDAQILRRIITLAAAEDVRACWCFSGASGRGESVTKVAPQVIMIVDDDQDESAWVGASQRVLELLNESGYLPNAERPFESMFYAAGVAEWKKRYSDWVSDPILKGIYRARPLFDLRPIAGHESLWRDLSGAVTDGISREFLHVVANDCLSTLPPLTFFQNAVLDETGEETAVFRLEESVLRPLVDVARVFGMAARKVFGTSTRERFDRARALLPDHASIFDEASDTLGIVLWQQGRIGISQGTAGAELPPALLNAYDRQILRSSFRSILRLLEFTGGMKWLNNL